jgi:hypothetical protein
MQKIYLAKENLISRPEVVDKINSLNAKTVLDVGGSFNNWLAEKVTHMFDFQDPHLDNGWSWRHIKSSATWFKGDINNHEDWYQIFDYVEKNGKFDFVSCTHTLEDLAYPMAALRNMPRIAKAGFIAVPSKYWELCRGVPGTPRGGHHHRWIFNNEQNKLLMYPKINLIEYMALYEQRRDLIIKNQPTELRLMWEDNIDFEVINNDYLGPRFEDVVNYYERLLIDGNDTIDNLD